MKNVTEVGSNTEASRIADLIKSARSRIDGTTTGAKIISKTATVGQCRFSAPKALTPTGIRAVPGFGIDKSRPIMDVDQRELQDSCVHSVLAGKASVTVVTAEEETQVTATRSCVHDTDQESIDLAVLVEKTLGTNTVDSSAEVYLTEKLAAQKKLTRK
jgi:hypothetical protein